MWTKLTTEDYYNWQDALAYCENLDFGGYSDWRLPNIKELRSIIDYTTEVPAIDLAYFPDTQSSGYWSSTTYHSTRLLAWSVGFYSGGGGGTEKTNGGLVRAVRDR
jgi:hypothetical protein